MKSQYDYIIVGAGLYGAVFARQMTNAGKRCLVIDKRSHVGGNLYCEKIEGINVHKYGPHIFHTNNKQIWDYVNSFVKFNNFIYSPLASSNGKLYNLPFNMNTFYQLWNTQSPAEVEKKITDQIRKSGILKPKNLEEQAICMVGTDVYEKLIKYYTEKQWGRSALELPASIIRRLPVRYTYNNNYFDDEYQGIPEGGYNVLISKLLHGIEVRTCIDFFDDVSKWRKLSDMIVYTGQIDQFYQYKFGPLEYRSLRFEEEILDVSNYQGVAVVNSTDRIQTYTRIIEHKHFEFGTQKKTVITREYPEEWKLGKEAFYPINDLQNNKRAKLYFELAECEQKVIFGGRLAEYKYYDMHQIIASALKKTKYLIKN
jgi:UDP-galactopyranose mutase